MLGEEGALADMDATIRRKRLKFRWSFETNILLSFTVAASVLIASLFVFGVHQAREQDQAEIDLTTHALRASLAEKETSFRGWLKGYALWDDLYKHMVIAPDVAWVDANMGPAVWKTYTMPMSGVFIVDEKQYNHYLYWASGRAPQLQALTGKGLPARLEQADRSIEPVISTIIFGQEPYMMGVSRIRPHTPSLRDSKAPKRYLIWFQPLTGKLLHDIGRTMSVRNLRWEPRVAPDQVAALNLFPDPAIPGRVTWTPNRPGSAMLHRAMLPAALLLGVTVLIGLSQYFGARRLARRLRLMEVEAEDLMSSGIVATKQAQREKAHAEELMARVQQQEGQVDRLSREREQERERRQQEAQAQAEETLARFERDFNAVLQPIIAIAEALEARARDLEQEAVAGRMAATIVVSSAQETARAVGSVVEGNDDLEAATSGLEKDIHAAVVSTRRAEETTHDLMTRLAALNEGAMTVEAVIEAVSGIAGRINMLALNAQIEAARAGEAGRGFAIVAEEVKGLATMTSNSTASVAETLRDIQANTQMAASGIGVIGQMMEGITSVTAASQTAVDRQAAIAKTIGATVDQAQSRVAATDAAIRKLSGLVNASEDMAKDLTKVASDLTLRSAQLSQSAKAFSATLRGPTADFHAQGRASVG